MSAILSMVCMLKTMGDYDMSNIQGFLDDLDKEYVACNYAPEAELILALREYFAARLNEMKDE